MFYFSSAVEHLAKYFISGHTKATPPYMIKSVYDPVTIIVLDALF